MTCADGTSAPRVLHVSHTAHPGGAELALARLLAGQRRWHAGVCAPASGGAFDTLVAHGVTLDRDLPALPTGGTRGRSPLLVARYLAALRAAAHRLRASPLAAAADLRHANTAAAAIICALADRRRAHPLVVHLRDLVSPDSLGRFGYPAFRSALRRADGVIANSRSSLDSAAGLIPAGRPAVVLQSPSGITARVTQPYVAPAVRVIGMIGRLQPWKGQHIFLDSFARAFQGTEVRAHLAGAPLFGETGYADDLRQLVRRLGIAGQVDFLGHVADIPGLLNSVDILVHASTRPEPLGQAVIQGLAYGKPVIASAGGGPSEWIRSGVNGWLVPPGQPAALAAAMRELAGSAPLRGRLAEGATRTAGIATDAECVDAHAGFFAEVRAATGARAGAGRRRR